MEEQHCGSAPAPLVPLGAGQPPAPVDLSTFSATATPSGARAFFHLEKTKERASSDGGADGEGSSSDEPAAGGPGAD